jgi:transketolase
MKLGKATRIAYGEEILELAKKNRDIVALDADLSKSTMSCLMEDSFPERFFEMSIAEQNMVGTAAGMALKGKIPFVNSFAVFMTGRAFDQIRQSVAYPKLNVKIGGSSAGFSDFGDGATHQSIEDLAIMRSLPNMIVLSPVDEIETREMVRFMVNYKGPVYIRLNRNDTPLILKQDYRFILGQPVTLNKGNDVTVFCTGEMVRVSLEAQEILEKEGISVQVVNISTIKPMNEKLIIDLVQNTKAVVTVEEHNIHGGLGSAISEVIMKTKIPIVPVGVKDRFGQSAGNYEELLIEYGLTKEEVCRAVKEVLKIK